MLKGTSDAVPVNTRGLTLPELLCIMAIVVLVLAIVIHIPPGHPRSKSAHAMGTINNMELAVTKMLSDAGQSNLRAFFREGPFNDAVAKLGRERNMDAFTASIEIYTYSTYVLLRKGRHALEIPNDYAETLNADVVGSLGDSYYLELAQDPWGSLYQIFPGPWPEEMGPVLFRKYFPSAGGPLPGESPELPDMLRMEGIDYATGDSMEFGWPAPKIMDVYIWSYGANGYSGQAHYESTHQYAPPALQHYREQEPELCGGGDDINNWDRDHSFMYFYN